MRWMAIGLIPLVLCGLMCFGGVILAALGLRHITDRPRDSAPVDAAADDIRTHI